MMLLLRMCILLAILAASYLRAYSYETQRLADAHTPDTTTTISELPADTPSETIPSTPYQVHTVESGETLYSIGKEYALLWSTIAAYNGMDDNTVLTPGMNIKIPLNEKGEVTHIEHLPPPTDAEKEHIRQSIKLGTEAWYADPVLVVRRTTPTEYHLKNDDLYTVINLVYADGTAMIEVQHDTRKLQIALAQVDPGKGNGWYITTIETQ